MRIEARFDLPSAVFARNMSWPNFGKAIVATGYKGFVGQEFIPTDKDKAAALRRALQICDVK